MATATTAPATTAEAERRFFARYGEQIGGNDWRAVQNYLGRQMAHPETVEGWIAVAEEVRGRPAVETQRPAPPPQPARPAPSAAPALTFAFTVRVQVGEVEGPLTITGNALSDVLTAVQLLPRTPGLRLIEEAKGWVTLPDGTPLCPKHGVPMKLRSKQGDEWHSHSVTGPDGETLYCKGYHGKDSPGYEY